MISTSSSYFVLSFRKTWVSGNAIAVLLEYSVREVESTQKKNTFILETESNIEVKKKESSVEVQAFRTDPGFKCIQISHVARN